MIPDNKQDLLDLISFALQEYGSSTLMKRELMEDGCVIKSFNSLNAKIHMVIAEKNKLYLRRYDVVDSNGENIVSFMLGHAAMLFAISAKKFREHLLATESIQGVITLKQSLFKQIVMPAAIILLDRKNSDTWLTSVETMEQLIGLMEGEIDERLTLYYTQDLSSDNMLPEYYNGDDKIIEHCFEGSETKELADIADIILGKGAKREDYKEQGIPYLRARDIQNGIIIHPEVSIDMAKKEQFAKQLIQEGDILLTKNFGQNKLAIVTDKDVPAIASNGLFIIRPFDVSEGYLYDYLMSKTGNAIFNKQLDRVKKGVTVPSISLKDLKKIEVPIFDEETTNNLERINSISVEEAIATTKKLMEKSKLGTDLERSVKTALTLANWNDNNFITGEDIWISIGNNKKWRPDFAYRLDDDRVVLIEVKSDLVHVNEDWISAIKHILFGEERYIFILTNGMYYEVHLSGIPQSIKSIQAPTIEEILNWEKEVC